ncbi:MAG: hypothetical protein J5I90_21390 [Caldilineales bacterium]|nr:hypothetical protein [Caldilineales bacterium]
MWKKIIGIFVLVVVIGLLVFGAVNRTQARAEKELSGRGAEAVASVEGYTGGGQGRGRTQVEATVQAEHEVYEGQGRGWQNQSGETADLETRGWQNRSAESTTQAGRGQQRQSQAAQNAQPLAESEDHEWLAWTGTVTAVDADELMLESDAGEQMLIEGRPWSFAQEAGFTAQVGDEVKLLGFDEDGEFETGVFVNQRSGQEVQIREESGRPLWAGRGRWGGE